MCATPHISGGLPECNVFSKKNLFFLYSAPHQHVKHVKLTRHLQSWGGGVPGRGGGSLQVYKSFSRYWERRVLMAETDGIVFRNRERELSRHMLKQKTHLKISEGDTHTHVCTTAMMGWIRIDANPDNNKNKKVDVFVFFGFSFVSKCYKDVDICW